MPLVRSPAPKKTKELYKKKPIWCGEAPVIPVLGRLRQKEHEFKANLGHLVNSFETLCQSPLTTPLKKSG
jgi:hypothetical protein